MIQANPDGHGDPPSAPRWIGYLLGFGTAVMAMFMIAACGRWSPLTFVGYQVSRSTRHAEVGWGMLVGGSITLIAIIVHWWT